MTDQTWRASPMTESIEPFHLSVPETAMIDLRERLSRTRWPDRETVHDTSQGAPLAKVEALCAYWHNHYDWRRCEATLNDLGQFITNIDGLDIHFLHIRSAEPNAFPLILTHGWPGTVLEFQRAIGPLVDPAAHGGNPGDAFHLIIPSLPGYGFSEKPTAHGWNISRIAAAWITLMDRLGYDRWGTQGGDWGALVTEEIGRQAPPGCVGLHLNFCMIALTPQEIADATFGERKMIADLRRYHDEQSSYLKMHTTSPQTLGYSLADSPAGLAGWMYAVFQDFTDSENRPEDVVTWDMMLDQIMIYWLTNSGASSVRLNWEAARERLWKTPSSAPIDIPAGFSIFPKEVMRASRRWLEKRYSKVVHYQEFQEGGHFAALEKPDVFADEIRRTFRNVRLP
ncbi:MAG: epoxide hydrolase family protein [Sphingobium sp.]